MSHYAPRPSESEILWKAYVKRDEESSTDAIFSASQSNCLNLTHSIQCISLKKRNPFAYQSLAWASWVIATLGGWRGSKTTPGVDCIHAGLNKLEKMHINIHGKANQNRTSKDWY